MRYLFAILLAALSAPAATVKLAWDASPDATNQPLTYVVYAGTNGTPDAPRFHLRQAVGTNQTAIVSNIAPVRWLFAAVSLSTNGVESDLSNVVAWDGTKPAPPVALTVTMERSPDLTNWAEFYRLRIER